MVILALECSTSAAKALVYDTCGGAVSRCAQNFGPAEADGTTQDADGVFGVLAACARQAVEQAGVPCDAVALVSTWHSLLLCGRDGSPLGRVRLWSDLSAAPEAAALAARPGFRQEFHVRTGCFVHASYPVFKWMHLHKTQPLPNGIQLYAQGEYLFQKLTGERAAARNIASGSGFLSLKTRGWDEQILRLAGVCADQLGTLCDAGFHAPLSAQGAAALGLPAGTPVFAGGADGMSTQLGCDAAEGGVLTMSVGTSAALRIAADAPLLPEEAANWCYYMDAGRYIAGAATSGACNCVNRFAAEAGRPVKELDTLLGRGGFESAPVFLPFWFGERCPGWRDEAYGGLFPDGGDLAGRYYAVLEGVLFNLYQCWLPLRGALQSAGKTPREIRLSGGILNCACWLQMCADIFGCEIHASETQHASLLGAVAVASAASGEAAGPLWHTDRVVRPDPAKRDYYARRFERYLECYRRENA